MFFVNYISRNDTDPFYPMFEVIYSVELILILLTFLAGLVVIYLHYKAVKLQRLVRLRNIFSILVDIIHAGSRIVIMHHQYFGASEYVETPSLIVGSMLKETFFGYMTALGFIVALDRCVATKAWSWYESGKKSTLLFFILQEGFLFATSISIAYLLVYDHISCLDSLLCFGAIFLSGSILIILVLGYNIREMRKLKQGAVVNRYSVARTFQIKENISVLTSYANVARVQIAMTTPPFVFFAAFLLIPQNIGFDGLRFFSAAMFDLWLSITSLTVICSLPYYFSHLRKALKAKGPHFRNTQDAGDAYFKMLANEWNK